MKKWSVEEKINIVNDWKVCETSQTAFCAKKGISPATLKDWKSRFDSSKPLASKRKASDLEIIEIPREKISRVQNSNRFVRIVTSYGVTIEVPL